MLFFSFNTDRIWSGTEKSWNSLRQQRGGWTARLARAAKLAVETHFEVSHMAPVLWTLYARTVWCVQGFPPQQKKETGERKLMMKSLPVVLNVPLGTETPSESDRSRSLCQERKGQNKRKTDAEGLPWTFWCSMRWQSHMNKSKMPGWRWCFSIPNMMERQSEVRIWHRQRKSNLLTVAVLNKCQSENAASLFKSIRGLGLTVSGGRSPLL